jgi:hypothetical protein
MSWGNHTPDTARIVAKAFYEGRTCKRGNCETDGEVYRLFGHPIARRNPEWSFPNSIAAKFMDRQYAERLEFTWAGFLTQTTSRHLNALGCDAHKGYASGKPPTMFGRKVASSWWYTPEELEETEIWKPAPKLPRAERFVNLTMPLFA